MDRPEPDRPQSQRPQPDGRETARSIFWMLLGLAAVAVLVLLVLGVT